MSATLQLKRGLGTSLARESDAFYDNFVQFGTIDSAQADASFFPIRKPHDSGFGFSIEVWLYLKVINAPNNNVTNIRFWGSPFPPSQGIFMYVGATSVAATPSLSTSSLATTNSTAYPDMSQTMLWSDTTMTSIGDTSEYLVMQMRVDSSAAVGDHAGEAMVYHYSYDES